MNIKKITAAALIAAMCATGAFAQTAVSSASVGASQEQGQQQAAVAGATNAGNSQNITFQSPERTNVDYSGNYTIKNVPNVVGPALTTSNDTCMGSTSGGLAIAGFGVSGGTTWTDTNCKRLKNSRELWNMGMRAASLALMCKDDENRDALEVTGFKCPSSKDDAASDNR